MKKFLLCIYALAFAIAAQADFTTVDGDQSYTLADLASIDGSGITLQDDSYLLDGVLTIAESDSFVLGAGETLKVAADAQVVVKGTLLTNTAEADAYIVAEDPAKVKSISVEDSGKATLSNTHFYGLGISMLSDQALTVDNCSFTEVSNNASSLGAVAFVSSNMGSIISNSQFVANETAGVGTAANAYCALTIENCLFEDCTADNSNRPMLNLTTPAENGPMTIRDNTILGQQRPMVGGISVANMVGGAMGNVTLEGNEIRDCRYGINVFGPMDALVKDNKLYDNRYEENPMNGGSAISCTAFAGTERVIIAGNHIEGSLWGVTLISYGLFYPDYYGGFDFVSLGGSEDGDIDSPGGNVFVANGTDGQVYDPTVPYDLYNNTADTVYAQYNTWSVEEQTPEEVAKVIFDKADDPQLGEVIYLPLAEGIPAISLSQAQAELYYDLNGRTVANPRDGQVLIRMQNGQATKIVN